jgi:2'-5' RNA ligase
VGDEPDSLVNRFGYGRPPGRPGCLCAHGRFTAPLTRNAAAAMAAHWLEIRPMCTLVTTDPERWLRVWRCGRCGEHWAEESITSGHAEFYFGYPIATADVPEPLELHEPAETALIVAVPEAEEVVGAYRAALDPVASWGVPAHVTVLYPFLPPGRIDDQVRAALGALFAARHAFDVALSRVDWFGPEVLWLAPTPDEPFRELTNAVWARFPDAPPYGGEFDDVIPHLTVGDHAPLRALRATAEDLAARLPITAAIRSVRLIEGTIGRIPWRTVAEFPLAESR